jgi:hypothetical protein
MFNAKFDCQQTGNPVSFFFCIVVVAVIVVVSSACLARLERVLKFEQANWGVFRQCSVLLSVLVYHQDHFKIE